MKRCFNERIKKEYVTYHAGRMLDFCDSTKLDKKQQKAKLSKYMMCVSGKSLDNISISIYDFEIESHASKNTNKIKQK